jgi:hypothetical protein
MASTLVRRGVRPDLDPPLQAAQALSLGLLVDPQRRFKASRLATLDPFQLIALIRRALAGGLATLLHRC